MQEEQRRQLVGRPTRGIITKLGRRLSVDTAGMDPVLAQFQNAVSGILVAFPSANVRVGMTWADTVGSLETHPMGLQVSTQIVTTYRVAADTVVAGRRSWHVESRGVVTTSGSGDAGGGPLSISGGGTMEGSYLISQDGAYLGGDQRMTLSSTVEAAGTRMPTTQTVTSRTRVLP
jgi:hypothetical protein